MSRAVHHNRATREGAKEDRAGGTGSEYVETT